MRKLGPRGMSPKAHYLSAAVYVPDNVERRSNGKLKYPICSNKKSGDIRFMIMEKVGDSLMKRIERYPGKKLPFILAIKYGIEMIQILEKYHLENIVHGDIHLGNYAFSLSHNNDEKLILIDFGRTALISPVQQEDVRLYNNSFFCPKVGTVPSRKWRIHPYTGKWEMRRCKPAFRDDVHRAVQMIAMAMYGTEHLFVLKDLIDKKDFEKYLDIKDNAKFFDFDFSGKFNLKQTINGSFPGGNISDDDYEEIVKSFAKISAEVSHTDIENPYRKPWYGLIISELEKISDKFTASSQ